MNLTAPNVLHAGTVTFYDHDKQFGFIRDADATRATYSVFQPGTTTPLQTGTDVVFHAGANDSKGYPTALKVRALPPSAAQQGAVTLFEGAVKWFDMEKGYGFITPDNGTSDLFVYHEHIISAGYPTLAADARVAYHLLQNSAGTQATDVVQLTEGI